MVPAIISRWSLGEPIAGKNCSIGFLQGNQLVWRTAHCSEKHHFHCFKGILKTSILCKICKLVNVLYFFSYRYWIFFLVVYSKSFVFSVFISNPINLAALFSCSLFSCMCLWLLASSAMSSAYSRSSKTVAKCS